MKAPASRSVTHSRHCLHIQDGPPNMKEVFILPHPRRRESGGAPHPGIGLHFHHDPPSSCRCHCLLQIQIVHPILVREGNRLLQGTARQEALQISRRACFFSRVPVTSSAKLGANSGFSDPIRRLPTCGQTQQGLAASFRSKKARRRLWV